MKGIVYTDEGKILYKFDTNSLPILKKGEHYLLTENIDAVPTFTPKLTLSRKIKNFFRK